MTRRRTSTGRTPSPGRRRRHPGREGPSEAATPASVEDSADRTLRRILGAETADTTKAALAARARVRSESPWPELLEALDRIDPDIAAVLRRFAGIPPPRKRRR